MKTLVIIPAYNEEQSILKVCDALNNYDILVINDGSIDKTRELLEKNNINHINLITNLGIGGAVQTGYVYAREHDYDIAVQFDGDGQHNAQYIEDIIKPITLGKYDMVIGSRFISEMNTFKSSKARRVGINIISFLIRAITNKKIYDTTSGMRAINKKIIKEFSNDYPTEYPEPVSTTMVLKKGYKVKEIPVKMNKRENGTSSIRSYKNVYYMINVMLYIIVVGLRRNKK